MLRLPFLLKSSIHPKAFRHPSKNQILSSLAYAKAIHMSTKPHTPIIVGVADIKNKSKQIEDAIEPSQLMLSAIQSALNDTALSKANQSELQHSLDSLSVVATWTWPYPDLPQLLSENLGASPRYKTYSQHGGNQPIKLVDEAARRVASGESKVAVVVGGEALASCKECGREGR